MRLLQEKGTHSLRLLRDDAEKEKGNLANQYKKMNIMSHYLKLH